MRDGAPPKVDDDENENDDGGGGDDCIVDGSAVRSEMDDATGQSKARLLARSRPPPSLDQFRGKMMGRATIEFVSERITPRSLFDKPRFSILN